MSKKIIGGKIKSPAMKAFSIDPVIIDKEANISEGVVSPTNGAG